MSKYFAISLLVSPNTDKDYTTGPTVKAENKGMALLKAFVHVRTNVAACNITVRNITQVEKPEEMFITVR